MSTELNGKRELTSLPLEVLRRVAELGTCDNALALRSVCHEFRALCSDPLLYSAIIDNGNGSGNLDAYEALPKPIWWHTSLEQRIVERTAFQTTEHDYSISYRALCGTRWWANVRSRSHYDPTTASRWALADLKALEWLDKGDRPHKNGPIVVTSPEGIDNAQNPLEHLEGLASCMKWLPELLLTGHPAIAIGCTRARECSGDDFTALLQAAEGSKDPDQQYRACLIRACYGVLYRTQPGSLEPLDFGPSQLKVASITGQQQLISAHPQHHTLFYASLSGSFAHHTHAILTLGILRELMFATALRHGVTERSKLPPVLHHIPSHTRIPVTAPFSSSGAAAADLSTAHLATMLSPSFLEDGEWVGYYDYRFLDAGEMYFDEIMTGMRFRATATAPAAGGSEGEGDGGSDGGRIELEARNGIDKHGRFRIIGTACRHSGVLQVVKEYEHGVVWDWVAVMTPFGIVGCWGETRWGGWLWLWKKSWVQER